MKKPTHFRSAALFRAWLEKHHDSHAELFVGFYRKDSGKGGIGYEEALDEALCFGWIDGVRHRVDELSYMNRFSPRKPKSYWSDVNIRKVEKLIAAGRMAPPGLAAFEKRVPGQAPAYSFENRDIALSPAYEKRLRANKKAWAYWSDRPPGYKRTVTHWVMSAKQEETRERRIAALIELAAAGKPIPLLGPSPATRRAAAKRKR